MKMEDLKLLEHGITREELELVWANAINAQFGSSPMKTTYDPTLDVPPHVLEAAKTIHEYFTQRGSDSWELMGICSRNRLCRLEQAVEEIRDIADRALESQL